MTAPRIHVQFTGETDQVAAAVRALTGELRGLTTTQRQTARAGAELAASGTRVASQFNQASAALGALATTVGLARLTGLVRDAIDTGDAIFKLSQKTGAGTEALSILAFAGRTADVSLEDLGTTLRFLSRSLGELQRGSPPVVAAFRSIGLSAADLEGLSVDEAFLRIATAQARYADGAGKAEAAMRIFGRSGSEIIPLLNDLADGGFDRAAAAARRMGLVFSPEAAKAAQDFNDSIDLVKASGAGLAGELTKGAIPALTQLATGTAEAIANLPGPIRTTVANLLAMEGGILGVVAALRILQIAGVGAVLANPFALAALGIGAVASVLLTLASNASRARTEYSAFLSTLTDTAAIDTERQRLELELAANKAAADATNSTFRRLALLRQQREIEGRLAELAERRTAVAAPDRPEVVVPDPAAIAARRAAQRAAIGQELELARDGIRAQEAINQQQFDLGLQGLAIYFRRRRGLIEEATAAEIRALEAERTATEREPAADAAAAIKREQDLARISNEILQRRTEGEARLGELGSQEALAQKGLAEQRLAFEQRILQARGQTLQAALDAIEQEARKFDELLVKQGVGQADRRNLVGDFRATAGLRAQIDETTKLAQEGFAAVDAERERVAQEVQLGVLTQRQGQEQLAAFERARLPVLRDLAVQMQAFASQLGDPALIQAAAQLSAQVDAIAASADLAAQRAARFRSQLLDAAEQSVVSVLGSGLDSLGAPDPNAGAIEVRRRQAEELQKRIDELNLAAANGNEDAAAQVRALEAEYESLQNRIAELQAETTTLFDVFRAGFVDLLEGIRTVLNELIAADLVEGIRGAFSRRGAPGAEGGLIPGAPVGLEEQDVGALATDAVQGVAETAPEAAAAAALSAAAAQTTVAAGALTGAGTSVSAGAAAVAASAGPVTGGAALLTSSAGALSGSGAILAAAAVQLQIAAAALAAAKAGAGGLAQGGAVRGVGSPTSDSNLIWASRDEFMQPARAVRHYGVPMMEDIRHLRFPKFATGGLVTRGAIAALRPAVLSPSIRAPSVPQAPTVDPASSLGGGGLRAELAGELRVLLERGLILDTVKSYMGSRDAETDHVRLNAATRSRRQAGGT